MSTKGGHRYWCSVQEDCRLRTEKYFPSTRTANLSTRGLADFHIADYLAKRPSKLEKELQGAGIASMWATICPESMDSIRVDERKIQVAPYESPAYVLWTLSEQSCHKNSRCRSYHQNSPR